MRWLFSTAFQSISQRRARTFAAAPQQRPCRSIDGVSTIHLDIDVFDASAIMPVVRIISGSIAAALTDNSRRSL
jgi:hypothetical protein